jgi:hypothetical protein
MKILGSWPRTRNFTLLLMAAPILALGQTPAPNPAIRSPIPPSVPSAEIDSARRDLATCHVHAVTDLPGSHAFASDFIEAMAIDPAPQRHSNAVWALTADLSNTVPARDRALYISKSTNGGKTWTQIARIDSRYFNAQIAEGLRNGLSVSPGGTDFVVTTQKGAFQVFPQPTVSDPIVKSIDGPRVPHLRPNVTISKKEGDPVRAGVVLITADGKHMIVGYGYFDDDPQLFTYRRDRNGSWIEDGTLPHLPTDLDIFSMQFDSPRQRRPGSLYVGTGDQAYRLNFRTMQWTRVTGVGPDSAIHSINTVGGPHFAACWGVYNPISADTVQRVTSAKFLLHRGKDQAGPNIRAYGIEVDTARPNRIVLSAITGVYTSSDHGQTWKRLNDLPEGEFHSAHFNPDGTVILSGYMGTFLANPFSKACAPHLQTRDR